MRGPDTAMDCFAVEGKLAMVTEPVDNPVYDFDFRKFFACSGRTDGLPGVARVGAIYDYASFYEECLERDVQLINSPEQQRRASRLPEWYPLLEGKTPRSRWYSSFPTAGEVEAEFGWPVFLKAHARPVDMVSNRSSTVLRGLRKPWQRSSATRFFTGRNWWCENLCLSDQ